MLRFMSENRQADPELVEHRRPQGVDEFHWEPYSQNINFNEDWWHRTRDLGVRYSLWSIFSGHVEVARLELDKEVGYDHYAEVPDLGNEVLEIDFLVVAGPFRGKGVGRQSVNLVARRFAGRRLVAFSEEADGFWASLGWTRYDHPEGYLMYRPLFVAPLGWPLH